MTRRLFALAALGCFGGCGSSISGFESMINVGFTNATAETLQVTVSRGDSSESLSAPPGYHTTQVEGTAGDVVVFQVVSEVRSGSGSCTSTEVIENTNEYGDVRIAPSGLTGVTITCLYGWEEERG